MGYAVLGILAAGLFGWASAVLGRARRDHAGAKTGLERARAAVVEAWKVWLAGAVAVVLVVEAWMHAKH